MPKSVKVLIHDKKGLAKINKKVLKYHHASTPAASVISHSHFDFPVSEEELELANNYSL
jgi:hypothetical protein